MACVGGSSLPQSSFGKVDPIATEMSSGPLATFARRLVGDPDSKLVGCLNPRNKGIYCGYTGTMEKRLESTIS